MMQDPIGSFCRIRDFFISYLDTAFRIEDPGVAAERRALLKRPGTLCSEPLIEPVLRYEPESSGGTPLGFTDMRQGLDEGSPDEWHAFVDLVLAGLFPSKGEDAFDRQPDFPPYAHQVRMLRRGAVPGKPGVVTSGTGSGKTESFLLPLFAQLVREGRGWDEPEESFLERRWWHDPDTARPYWKLDKKGRKVVRYKAIPLEKRPTKAHPATSPFREHREGERRPAAVRALVLYPMNALVEDQMVRLRKALDSQEARAVMRRHLNGNHIFFGRYTGATPVTGHHLHPGLQHIMSSGVDGSVWYPGHKRADESGNVSYEAIRAAELDRRDRQLAKLFDTCVELERGQAQARFHAADALASKKLAKAMKGTSTGGTTPADFLRFAEGAGWQRLDKLRERARQLLGDAGLAEIDDALTAIASSNGPENEAPSAFGPDDSPFLFPSIDGSEMTNRWDMQATPPDILITNVSMLGAMLNREVEALIFSKTKEWLTTNDDAYFYLILDELHLQRGSAGTEVAYLIRLLLHRLGLTDPKHRHKVRVLASSASLPDAPPSEAKKSASYLWDMFGWFGLGEASGMAEEDARKAWLEAISPGTPFVRPEPSSGTWDPGPFLKLLTVHEQRSPHGKDGTLFALDPSKDAEAQAAWRALADAIGVEPNGDVTKVVASTMERVALRLLHTCHDGRMFRATTGSHLLERCFGIDPSEYTDHPEDHLRILRALTLVRGLGDGLEEAIGKLPPHVSSFRVHTFFRSVEGLYAPAVSGLGSHEDFLAQRESEVGVLTVDKAPRIPIATTGEEVRLYELAYCECCGELFFGGMTGNKSSHDKVLTELLPTEPNLEGLPDQAVSQRFEELSSKSYAVFWPRRAVEALVPEKMTPAGKPNPNCKDDWTKASLERRTGAVKKGWKEDAERYCSGWLYRRRKGEDKHKRRIDSAGTNVPYACPRCGTSYYSRITTDYRLSPIRNFRAGFGKTTQLLATELFDAQRTAGRHSGDDPKLVSFSDSRQDAARAALAIERNHHQDLRREALVSALREAASQRTDPAPIRRNIAKWEERAESDDPDDREVAERKLPKLKRQLRDALDSSVPLDAVVEPHDLSVLATRHLGLKPLIRSMVDLGVHPYDPAGRERPAGGTKPNLRRFPWPSMFEPHDGHYRWAEGSEKTEQLVYEARRDLVQRVHAVMSDVIFSKTYFSLEEAGLGFPTVGHVEGRKPEQRQALDALIRVLTDAYRYRPNPFGEEEEGKPEWRTWGEVTSARVKRLLESVWGTEASSRLEGLLERLGLAGHAGGIVRMESLRIEVAKASDPYVRCKNCRRVHLHPGWGRCTRCAEPLDWEKDQKKVEDLWTRNFLSRRIQRSKLDAMGAFRLHCEELTGQTEDGAHRQQTFKGIFLPRLVEDEVNTDTEGGGSEEDEADSATPILLEDMPVIERRREEIDLLTVTTTMEVGIDIGPLQTVLQANMPPQRFNYQQRVGRAGRRGQAFSMAVTICRTRSHDVYYFGEPEKITGDVPPPPFLTRSLDPIATRFLLKGWLWEAFRLLREEVRGAGGVYPADLQSPPDIHGEYLPTSLLDCDDTDPTSWWCRLVATVDESHAFAEALEQLLVEGGRPLESPRTRADVEAALRKAKKDGRQGSIAHDLAELGELPMFGMPTRVRDLYLRLRKRSGRQEWSRVDRDLDLAIYDFAPGSTLVIDKAEYLAVGFTPALGDPFHVRGGKAVKAFRDDPFGERLHLAECPACHAWTQLDSGRKTCGACDQPLDDVGQACVVPNAFRTDLPGFARTKEEGADQGIRHRSIQAEGTFIDLQQTVPFGSKGSWVVRLAHDQKARTFRINRGPNREKGGRGFITRLGVQELPKSRGGVVPLLHQAFDERYADEKRAPGLQPSGAASEPLWLAAPKTTDALYIAPSALPQFLAIDELPSRSDATPDSKDNARWTGVRAAALSATFILVGRAAIKLDVDPEEFDVLEPRLYGPDISMPLLHITDHLVNGAGLCARLDSVVDGDVPLAAELIRSILEDEHEYPLDRFLAADHKGCDQSCYRCLQRYGNSPYHSLLDWQLGLAFLRAMVDPTFECGLDQDFSVPELRRFPALAKDRADEMNRRFGHESDETRRQFGGFEAFRVKLPRTSELSPWVLVVHPLWRTEGPPEFRHPALRAAAKEALLDADARPVFWDTFNLSRRPGFVRERIKAAAP